MNKRMIMAVAAAAGLGLASVAFAQSPAQPAAQTQSTPKGWNYQLDKNGHRIPKGNRVTNADGSWREEIKQGKCTTVKEMSAGGVYKETSSC